MATKKKAIETTKQAMMTDGELDTVKICNLLLEGKKDIRKQVCVVLGEGLKATKPVVCDGEIFTEVDFPTRLKYAETIAEILGERKKVELTGDLHYHFTNILQQIRAYENDPDRKPSVVGQDSKEA